MTKKANGFTLLEVLVVASITVFIGTILVQNFRAAGPISTRLR